MSRRDSVIYAISEEAVGVRSLGPVEPGVAVGVGNGGRIVLPKYMVLVSK